MVLFHVWLLCIDGCMSNYRFDAIGTLAPIDDLGFVDVEPGGVVRGEARYVTDGAIDIDRAPARTADEMMVVVPHPDFIAGG